MHKLLTSKKGCDDLSNGLDRDRNRRRDELSNNKNVKYKYHLRITPKDIFGYKENQEKATYGSDYKLTLTRNKDDAVVDKAAGIADARIEIHRIQFYVPHYAPSIQQQGVLSKKIMSKTPTEFRYVKRSFFLKEVKSKSLEI